MTLSPTILRQVQLKELEILLEVKRICDKHQIGYQLCGGTLLGAVRHQGFIPWDDDIDITMLRDDYERFLTIAPGEISDKYFVESARTDPDYIFSFCKVRANGTKFIEEELAGLDLHHGIWIDIFPLDIIPELDFDLLEKRQKKLRWLQTSINFNAGILKLEKPTSYLFFKLHGLLNRHKLIAKKERFQKKIHRPDGKYVIEPGCPYGYQRTLLPVEIYHDLIQIQFEGHQFSTVNDPHLYLETMYGDYMQLPPVEERTSGHSIICCEV